MNSPEKRDDDSPPPRRSRSEMDAHERKLWDLNDGDDLLEDDLLGLDDDLETSPAKPEPVVQEEIREEESPASALDDKITEPVTRVAEEASDERPNKSSLSPIEKISLSAFGLVTIVIAVWLISFFFRTLPTDDPTITADFPVEGKSVVVSDITTYWRKPNAKDRGVRTSAKVIPAGVITLGEGKGRGALRIFFEDDQGDPAGDPISVTVSNGKFSPLNKNALEVICSDGFSQLGDFPGYLTGQIDLWYMIVMEGPNTEARGRDFQEILRLPIARERR